MKTRKIKAHQNIIWARTNKTAMKKLSEQERELFVTHNKNKIHGWRSRARTKIEYKLYKMGVLIPSEISIYYVWAPWQFTRTRQTTENWPPINVKRSKRCGVARK